jgi:hypothetical protein
MREGGEDAVVGPVHEVVTVTSDRRPQGAPSWLPRFTHRFIAVHDPAPFMPRLATLAGRNATANPSPSKTCPPRSASRMPRPPGTAGSQARTGLSRGDGVLGPA